MIGFATQTASLWLQVPGDMKEVYMIMNGSSNTRTKGLQMKPAVVRIKTNKRRWLWIMNGDLHEREIPFKNSAWF